MRMQLPGTRQTNKRSKSTRCVWSAKKETQADKAVPVIREGGWMFDLRFEGLEHEKHFKK